MSPTHAYIAKGDFAEKPPEGSKTPVLTMHNYWDNWFYIQIAETNNASGVAEVYMPTKDYLHRHTAGIFWELSYLCFFTSWKLPRVFLGWLWPPKIADAKQVRTSKKITPSD